MIQDYTDIISHQRSNLWSIEYFFYIDRICGMKTLHIDRDMRYEVYWKFENVYIRYMGA